MPKKNQLEFEMPRTELGKLADRYLKQLETIKEEKTALDQIGERIMDQLQKEGRRALAIQEDGMIYYFEVRTTGTKLVVSKAKTAAGYTPPAPNGKAAAKN